MGTEILKSFGSLQSELEQARSSLKGVDENIKRLIGRDPSEIIPRPVQKRIQSNDDKGRANAKNINRLRSLHENDEPPIKRRNNNISVFKRLSDRPLHDHDVYQGSQKQIISKVIVTPKDIPSREEALEAQNKDEKFKARNRRMFGALLGTLQKFQQEETKLKPREDKRAQLEKKIEEHEIKEKEEIKKERQELFLNRKKKQTEIKIIELKMMRMKEYTAWENSQIPRKNFILTKAEPHIHYLPRRLDDKSKELLNASKVEVEAITEKKKTQIFEELKHIEDRIKHNFDSKFGLKEIKSINDEKHESVEADHDDHFDEVLMESVTETNVEAITEQTEEITMPMEIIETDNMEQDQANHNKENTSFVNNSDKETFNQEESTKETTTDSLIDSNILEKDDV